MMLCACLHLAQAQQNAAAPDTAGVHAFSIADTFLTYLREPIAPKPLRWKAFVVPAGLITYGTLSVTSGWLDNVNLLGRRWASDNENPNYKTSIDDYTQLAPAAAVLGLRIAGIRGKNNIMDEAMLIAMSGALMNAIVIPLKSFSREQRPDSSDNFSFPSGHTATAFLCAEFLRQEYKDRSPWIGAGGYAVAVFTGYLRMYNNKHWFSDVLAGAGGGIFSTRVSYWVYPKLKNLILSKPAPATALLLPTYQSGMPGFCFVLSF
jgi:membrane-associated phospholipid phosphatase